MRGGSRHCGVDLGCEGSVVGGYGALYIETITKNKLVKVRTGPKSWS